MLELLAVIVIIALLAVLFLPVLQKARAVAHSIYCLNQVRQWSLAVWMYGEDQEERYPYEGNFLEPIDAGRNEGAWYNALKDYHGQAALAELYWVEEPPRPGQRGLYTCPATFREISRKPTVRRPYFMYGFNNRMDPNGPRQFRRSMVRLPDQTVIFTENSEDRFPSTAGRFTPARHRGRANLGFADGHAEGVRSNLFRRTALEDESSRVEWAQEREVYWYPYPGAPL